MVGKQSWVFSNAGPALEDNWADIAWFTLPDKCGGASKKKEAGPNRLSGQMNPECEGFRDIILMLATESESPQFQIRNIKYVWSLHNLKSCGVKQTVMEYWAETWNS